MDNLPAHKIAAARDAIEVAGTSLLYLRSYNLDFNPIENAFVKLKAMMRAKAERTISALWNAASSLIKRFTPAECENDFRARQDMDWIKPDGLEPTAQRCW